MAKASLVRDVLSRVRSVRRATAWYDRLPADVVSELSMLRVKYAAGALGDMNCTALARAIVESLEAREMHAPKVRAVTEWLRASR